MILKSFLSGILFILIFVGTAVAEIPDGDIALFSRFTGNYIIDDILQKSEMKIFDVLNLTGRFIPVEYNRKMEYLKRTDGKDAFDLFKKTSERMGLDLYIVLEGGGGPGNFWMTMSVFSVSEKFKNLKRKFIILSEIPENIPLKAGRDIAMLFSSMQLRAFVKSIDLNGNAVIDAGQWHGLKEGAICTQIGTVTVVKTGRYISVISRQGLKVDDVIVFDLLPRSDLIVNELKRAMVENLVMKYGPDRELKKRGGAVKESLLATCIINPGASLLLPGYGSHLSMEYLGLKNSSIDGMGVMMGMSLVGFQFLLPSMMNDFKINFFPWIDDADKSDQTQRLQTFMWATLPLTYTATFYDQLSAQYSRRGLIPPLFENRNSVSSFLSFFVPGGGLFYKGYRKTGWGFYFSEMSLLSYGIYNSDDVAGNYALGIFAGVKILDLLCSYFVEPSYSAYRNNTAHDRSGYRLDVRISRGASNKNEIYASIVKPF